MPIFSPTRCLVASFILAMVSSRLYRVRPQPGHEMYSVFTNLTLAACSIESARSVSFSFGKPSFSISSLCANPSMKSAPVAIAAFSCRSSHLLSLRLRVTVSSLIVALASSLIFAHSGIISTSLRATGISFSGASDRLTLIVSPMPSQSRAPMPTALFILPSSPSPASVTPRCRGKAIPSFSISLTSSRTVRTITTVLLAFIEITTLLKFSFTQIRRNSIHDSTIPAGVSP